VISSALRVGGGPLRTAKRALRVVGRDGLAGLRRGLHIARQAGGSSDRNDYAEWIRRYDTMSDELRDRMRNIQSGFETKPLISVLLPVYNPGPQWLTAAIDSVLGQIYEHWELCIADDASTDPQIRPLLERYQRSDPRIKVEYRVRNGHIAAASNSALALAAGDWIAFLDHDDLLSEQALFWVVEAINRHPDAGMLYSDEDRIDERGTRIEPYFKPDWNYDLLLSQNFVCHLGVYRKALVERLGGLRTGFEGAQDWDLALRCGERLDPGQIIHIPWVLYHWRAHAGSTALSVAVKPYARDAGLRAVRDHLRRNRTAATVRTDDRGYCRVAYELPEPPPLVSLIVPTRNGLDLLRRCIESILGKTEYPSFEILIVDNGSDEPAVLRYLAGLGTNPRVRVMRDDRPFNFSALNNRAVEHARGEVIGLVNNDIEVITTDWLNEMVALALQPGVGAVGARLWYPDDRLQHGGIVLGIGGVAGHAHKRLPKGLTGYFGRAALVQSFSAVTAACLVVRKALYQEVGGLDESRLTVAFNDVDFCLKLRERGCRNLWTPYAELYHHESATRGYEDTPEKQARFARELEENRRRWSDVLKWDPAYNPNLTVEHEDFSLAWPPRSPRGTFAVSQTGNGEGSAVSDSGLE
jgi:glycosyltransferase involved in cell wall biosynthesis